MAFWTQLGWRGVAILFSFVLIVIIFIFGIVTEASIPFGPPISIADVIRNADFSILSSPRVPLARYLIVIALGFAAIVAYLLFPVRKFRVGLAIACILCPLVHTGLTFRGIALWIIAVPFTPFYTLTALMGQEDGEFYAEGFPKVIAVGWWMILWLVLLVSATRSSETRDTEEPAVEA